MEFSRINHTVDLDEDALRAVALYCVCMIRVPQTTHEGTIEIAQKFADFIFTGKNVKELDLEEQNPDNGSQ